MPMNARLLRPRLSGDPDALRYIAAVQQADGNTLEPAIRKAITDFVVGCKQDGIWTAIKASCILMGARTLSGALTPLVGSAPTNNGPFASGDYNRKTGLIGNGTTKWLNSNRNNNADPQDSQHLAAYVETLPTAIDATFVGGGTTTGRSNLARTSTGNLFTASRQSTGQQTAMAAAGFVGFSRAASAAYTRRIGGASGFMTSASQTPQNVALGVFARGAGVDQFSDARMAFYSIGESLDIALLDARVSTLYTAIGSALAPNYADADVNAYINAVETADGQLLETGVRDAINDFIVGCKADGIWSAIKASCILMGARTLSGALTPLVGTAPTNVNFVSGDYNRKTGLVGNGSTKYLNSNRAGGADGTNDAHLAAYISTHHAANAFAIYIGSGGVSTTGANNLGRNATPDFSLFARCRSQTSDTSLGPNPAVAGFAGWSRSGSSSYTFRTNSADSTVTRASQGASSLNLFVFARLTSSGPNVIEGYSDGRMAFYSIGSALTLSLLDSRVSTLYTAIGAAIP